MTEEKNLRFFRLLREDEKIRKPLSPFGCGLTKKCAKRIFDAFSVHIINTEIFRHTTPETVFFRIKTVYCLKGSNPQNYVLTTKTSKDLNMNDIKKFLKEYFYLKLIFHIFSGKSFY